MGRARRRVMRRWVAQMGLLAVANGEWVAHGDGSRTENGSGSRTENGSRRWVAQMGRVRERRRRQMGSRTEKETDGVATEKETDGVRDGEEVAADERYHAVDSPAWRESRVI
ncbi:hypothetical protein Adt_41009 [Abeliophyllum distichum]|uniref:Secreted protein n=1 Tax=Abeliophyllum distichum TaxID=126358 RepID=A0ABD1PP60_9LAMI